MSDGDPPLTRLRGFLAGFKGVTADAALTPAAVPAPAEASQPAPRALNANVPTVRELVKDKESEFVLSPSMIGEYMLLDCDRYLRLAGTREIRTMMREKQTEAAQKDAGSSQSIAEARMQRGQDFEEELLEMIRARGDKAYVADNERQQYSPLDTIRLLSDPETVGIVYHATFNAPVFVDSEKIVKIGFCEADFIQINAFIENDQLVREFLVVDAKATKHVAAKHRAQVAVYGIVLQHLIDEGKLGPPGSVRMASHGGVWLPKEPQWQPFEMAPVERAVREFLNGVGAIFRGPAERVPWHLAPICAVCKFNAICTQEAEQTQDISLVPYISRADKQALNAMWARHAHEISDIEDTVEPAGAGAASVDALSAPLERVAIEEDTYRPLNIPRARKLIKLKGPSESPQAQVKLMDIATKLESLESGRATVLNRTASRIPEREDVRIVFTLVRNPLEDVVCSWGLAITCTGGAAGATLQLPILDTLKAGDAPDAAMARLVRCLHDIFSVVHEHNSRADAPRCSLQLYGIDRSETDVLRHALLQLSLNMPPPQHGQEPLTRFPSGTGEAAAGGAAPTTPVRTASAGVAGVAGAGAGAGAGAPGTPSAAAPVVGGAMTLTRMAAEVLMTITTDTTILHSVDLVPDLAPAGFKPEGPSTCRGIKGDGSRCGQTRFLSADGYCKPHRDQGEGKAPERVNCKGKKADGGNCGQFRHLNKAGYCTYHFRQDPEWTGGEFVETMKPSDQPAKEMISPPLVVLLSAVAELISLPVHVSYTLADCYDALRPHHGGAARPEGETCTLDEIYTAYRKRDIRIHSLINRRLVMAEAVLKGVRNLLVDKGVKSVACTATFGTVQWRSDLHPTAARLAFIAEMEAVTAWTATQEQRMMSLPAQLLLGHAYELTVTSVVDNKITAVLKTQFAPEAILEGQAFTMEPDWVVTTRNNDYAIHGLDELRRIVLDKRYLPPDDLPIAFATQKHAAMILGPDTYEIQLDMSYSRVSTYPKEGDKLIMRLRFRPLTLDKSLRFYLNLARDPVPSCLRFIEDPIGFSAGDPAPLLSAEETDALMANLALNPSQLAAFRKVRDSRLSLVWGPPGTGKTEVLGATLAVMLRQAITHSATTAPLRVLVCAKTHSAIDNVLQRTQRMNKRLNRPDAAPVEIPVLKYSYDDPNVGAAAQHDKVEWMDAVGEAVTWVHSNPHCVVGMTVWGLRNLVEKGGKDGVHYLFDMVIIDEASQAPVSEAAIAINEIAPRGRIVLAGDPHQLPPIVQTSFPTLDPPLTDSIFVCTRHLLGARDGVYVSMLEENLRMNHDLCDFTRRAVYPDCGYRSATEEIAQQTLRLNMEQINGQNATLATILNPAQKLTVVRLADEAIELGRATEAEAVVAATLVKTLLEQGYKLEDIFVVTPHHVQRRAVTHALAVRGVVGTEEVPLVGQVNTVEKMQGKQAEVVIVCYVVPDRDTLGREASFLLNRNRLNVAVTRAKCKCILLVSSTITQPGLLALSSSPGIARAVDFIHFLLHYRPNDAPIDVSRDGVEQLRGVHKELPPELVPKPPGSKTPSRPKAKAAAGTPGSSTPTKTSKPRAKKAASKAGAGAAATPDQPSGEGEKGGADGEGAAAAGDAESAAAPVPLARTKSDTPQGTAPLDAEPVPLVRAATTPVKPAATTPTTTTTTNAPEPAVATPSASSDATAKTPEAESST